ncbi:MAG: phosphoribosylamine--glycine ligase [Candidatus Omnitrophica bacterium]|nr:phosphoribosylamine--glycine ligase [Candidatus Omnitrophota bacterium]MBU1133729.1 phosphoribosylamine--glycine ligase [Candidatus Omnitrophota bacterium]MBU1811069.1 phosphoribosylamine--glycine ligase [Candidatus Omnitrophota bacterium]
MKILIIGSGGREHCLAWKIAQSPLVDKIYCAPGNGGTSLIARNVDIRATDIDSLLKFAQNELIDLTVAGSEAPLVEGIVDKFEKNGLKIFGPKKELALLEGSKIFAKEVMKRYGIFTAEFEVFDNLPKAREYIEKKGAPIVVKADGLAAGKGVIVAKSIEEAQQAIEIIMCERKFGASGDRVIIEDCLQGEEVSIMVFTDGENIVPLVSSQDHKRVFDGDRGSNTGGMGAYAPAAIVTNVVFEKIIKNIFKPLIEGLKKEGKIYKGVLYAGLMIKDGEPYVLEFNVRFGDPEIQAILPKLNSDLMDVMLKTIDGRLESVELEWDERFCLCVVLASGGYPGNYEKGKKITGLEKLENMEDIFLFHAGTKQTPNSELRTPNFVTNGGRVLNVVGLGSTIEETQGKVYKAIENINFENMHYRRDIGDKALKCCAEKY